MVNEQRLITADAKMIDKRFNRFLIDRDEFLKECNRLINEPPFVHPGTTWDKGLLLAAEVALRLHPVDPVKHGRWIPVTEKLPESYERVLISCKEVDVPIVGWCDPEWDEWYGEHRLSELKYLSVTHWMPLPKIPKGE